MSRGAALPGADHVDCVPRRKFATPLAEVLDDLLPGRLERPRHCLEEARQNNRLEVVDGFEPPFTARGMISTQFVQTPAGWKTSATAWDDERPGLSIPEQFEPTTSDPSCKIASSLGPLDGRSGTVDDPTECGHNRKIGAAPVSGRSNARFAVIAPSHA